jgi:hypothetical protein
VLFHNALLEYGHAGCNAQVFLHYGNDALQIYYGPGEVAKHIYATLKDFASERREGCEYYEQRTGGGLQWREKIA